MHVDGKRFWDFRVITAATVRILLPPEPLLPRPSPSDTVRSQRKALGRDYKATPVRLAEVNQPSPSMSIIAQTRERLLSLARDITDAE